MINNRLQPHNDVPTDKQTHDRFVAQQTVSPKNCLENCMTPDSWDRPEDSPFLMRRGRPDDIDLALEFERRLSAGTRYFRFGKMQDLGFDRDRLAWLFNPDDDRNIHYIATIASNSREVMIASGRLVIPSEGSASELLIVVGDEWQRHGVGKRLVSVLCREAMARDVQIVYCQVLPTNLRMQTFMRSCGFRPASDPGHELLLRFEKRV